MRLTRGQNAPLPTTAVRFTATGDTVVDLSALVVDTTLRARSSDDFVFHDRPRTGGVRWGTDGVDIDLGGVRSDAHAVLCVVGIDPPAATSTVAVALTDHTGAAVARFDIDCRSAETSVICWELYRRAGGWKVRAVGQGYPDGLTGLTVHHGADVGETLEPAAPSVADTPAASEYGPIAPLDPDRIVERCGMIVEDAARSAGAYLAAREFAQARLDRELTAAVTDPVTRTGPAAVEARTRAQHRYDTVVAEAHTRYRRDAAHLDTELRTVGPLFPRSFADWDAPAWTTGTPEFTVSDGFRVGDLSAPECGPLRVPVCVPFPLRRPVRVVGADTPATARVTRAVILRILAADRDLVLDAVDLSGNLRGVTGGLAHRGGVTITRAEDVGPFLESTAAAAELALLDRRDGHGPRAAPRLVVLDHFPYGYDARNLPRIAWLTAHGPAVDVHTVIVGDDRAALELIHPDLPHGSVAVPAADDDWCDPWTSHTWTFTPDRAPAETGRVVDVLVRATR